MGKKVWAEGDVLKATTDDGLNNNVLQYVNNNNTVDTQVQTASETQFANKAVSVTNVKKRIVVFANCRLERNASDAGANQTVATFRLKVGTTFGGATTRDTLVLEDARTGTDSPGLAATPSCGVLMQVDEATDFTGDDQIVYVSVQFTSGSAGTATCDKLLVLGA